MARIIHTEEVWKTYGQGSPREVNAIRDISIEIAKGEITAFGGPSGSGKTTILSILGLLAKPTRGRVYLDGNELSSLSEVYRTKVRRERIGFIFQAQYLIPQLTSVENVALPKLCTDMSRADAEALAREKLIGLGLEKRADFRVAELSGGEQQRVSIARALMNAPDILIADEPGASIDESLTKDLLGTLREMSEEESLTVIVASHDPKVLSWADHIYKLQDGGLLD